MKAGLFLLAMLVLLPMTGNAKSKNACFEGGSKYDKGAYQDSVELLDRCLEGISTANQAFYLLVRGNAHFRLNDYSKAESDFTKAIDIAPKYPEGYYQRGKFYDAIGRAEEAVADFSSALALDATDILSRQRRAALYAKLNKQELSDTDTEILALQRENPYIWLGPLWRLRKQEQLKFFEEHYDRTGKPKNYSGEFKVNKDSIIEVSVPNGFVLVDQADLEMLSLQKYERMESLDSEVKETIIVSIKPLSFKEIYLFPRRVEDSLYVSTVECDSKRLEYIGFPDENVRVHPKKSNHYQISSQFVQTAMLFCDGKYTPSKQDKNTLRIEKILYGKSNTYQFSYIWKSDKIETSSIVENGYLDKEILPFIEGASVYLRKQ